MQRDKMNNTSCVLIFILMQVNGKHQSQFHSETFTDLNKNCKEIFIVQSYFL